ESHLKTTGCDTENPNFTPDVCLTDGSQFKYGTFDESCTDNICDTLTIDTNGKKGPNKEGKDRFTMNLTPNGLKALGESDTCSTGLDCGAYILAHHKLFDGETGSTTPAVEKTVAEKTADALSACDASSASTCKINDDVTLSKIGDYWTTPTMNSSDWGDAVSTTLSNGDTINSYQDGAKEYCKSQGLRLPTVSELQTLQSTCSTNGLGCNGWFWSSELVEGNERNAYGVYFLSGFRQRGSRDNDSIDNYRAVCVGN
ncbi:DUF1566 domain-containing protein, partial [bacterium]|nr:DUF1566 domain-containing protein [bacterium]